MYRAPELPKQMQDVISYEDDVFAWMYYDQVDRMLRYEAFVIGYDEDGEPRTLELVIEEGILDPRDYPLIQILLTTPRIGAAPAGSNGHAGNGPSTNGHGGGDHGQSGYTGNGHTAHKGNGYAALNGNGYGTHAGSNGKRNGSGNGPGKLPAWCQLTREEWDMLHSFCAREEMFLKRKHRTRWTHRLKALGYDVIGTL